MPDQPAPDAIRACLQVWFNQTGQELVYQAVERMLFDFWRMGFTADDLTCVLVHMKRLNGRMTTARFAFRFHKVVGDLEWFGPMLGEARAGQRHRPARTRILDQWRGRPPEGAAPARTATAREAVKAALTQLLKHLDKL